MFSGAVASGAVFLWAVCTIVQLKRSFVVAGIPVLRWSIWSAVSSACGFLVVFLRLLSVFVGLCPLFWFSYCSFPLFWLLTMKFNPLNLVSDPLELWHRVNALKEEGNTFFRKGMFGLASVSYAQAMELIHFDFPYPYEIIPKFQSLVICLGLNLAACGLKMENFEGVRTMCSFVLRVSSNNIKAYFRRAMAFQHLGSFEDARKDLETALEIEPRNTDVCKELEALRGERKGGCGYKQA